MNQDSRGRGRKRRYFETLGEFGSGEEQHHGGLGFRRMKKLHACGEKILFPMSMSRGPMVTQDPSRSPKWEQHVTASRCCRPFLCHGCGDAGVGLQPPTFTSSVHQGLIRLRKQPLLDRLDLGRGGGSAQRRGGSCKASSGAVGDPSSVQRHARDTRGHLTRCYVPIRAAEVEVCQSQPIIQVQSFSILRMRLK